MEERIENTEENQNYPYQYNNLNFENSSESQQIQNSSNDVIDTESTKKYTIKVNKNKNTTSNKYVSLSEDEIHDLIQKKK